MLCDCNITKISFVGALKLHLHLFVASSLGLMNKNFGRRNKKFGKQNKNFGRQNKKFGNRTKTSGGDTNSGSRTTSGNDTTSECRTTSGNWSTKNERQKYIFGEHWVQCPTRLKSLIDVFGTAVYQRVGLYPMKFRCAWACPRANSSAGCARLALPNLTTADPLTWLAALWGGDPLGPAWLLITAAAHPASPEGSVPADLRRVLALAQEAARAVGPAEPSAPAPGLRLLAGARLVREEIARQTCWALPRPLAARPELRRELAAAGAPDDAALEAECREWRVQLDRLCCWSACCCVLGTVALVPALLTGPLSLLVRWDARALGCLLLALGAGSLLSWLLCVPLAARIALRLYQNAWGDAGLRELERTAASASCLRPGPAAAGDDAPPPAGLLPWYVRHVTECYVALWSLGWSTCALVPLAAYLSPWPWFVGTDRLLDLPPPPSAVLVLVLAAVPVGLALPWGWMRDESSALRGAGPAAADEQYRELWYDQVRDYREWRTGLEPGPPPGAVRCTPPGGAAQTERDLRHVAAVCASLDPSQLGLLLAFLTDRCTELARRDPPPRPAGDPGRGDTGRGDMDRGDTDRGDPGRWNTDRGDTDRGDTDRGDTDRGDTGSGGEEEEEGS
eukprot:g11912.t1